VGRIERGGGDGGKPARSPPGWLSFRRPRGRACGCVKLRACRVVARLGTLVSYWGL